MVKYVQAGDAVNYTPTEAVASGSIVIQGGLVGIATRNLEANVAAALAVVGVFSFEKETGDSFVVGEAAYLIVLTGMVTTTAGANTYLGKAFKAAEVADTTVDVRLAPDDLPV